MIFLKNDGIYFEKICIMKGKLVPGSWYKPIPVFYSWGYLVKVFLKGWIIAWVGGLYWFSAIALLCVCMYSFISYLLTLILSGKTTLCIFSFSNTLYKYINNNLLNIFCCQSSCMCKLLFFTALKDGINNDNYL